MLASTRAPESSAVAASLMRPATRRARRMVGHIRRGEERLSLVCRRGSGWGFSCDIRTEVLCLSVEMLGHASGTLSWGKLVQGVG